LITSRAAGIISTIRSRCAKINIKSQNRLVGSDIYVKITAYIANYANPKVKLDLIEEFTNKNKESWGDFACSMLYLVNRITKKSLNINIEFNELENKIFNQLRSNSPDYLVTKFANIKRIINSTIDYDLDLRANTIALIEELW
jgi:DNA polymerase-3 subunit delta'